jgi:hypothetical protein
MLANKDMARKDQLNIPIANELKESWKEWAKARGTTITELITGLALHCIEGEPLNIPGGIIQSEGISRGEFEELKKKLEALEARLSSQSRLGAAEMGEGLGHVELARKFNLSPKTVASWARRYHATKPGATYQNNGEEIPIPPHQFKDGKWQAIANGDT